MEKDGHQMAKWITFWTIFLSIFNVNQEEIMYRQAVMRASQLQHVKI